MTTAELNYLWENIDGLQKEDNARYFLKDDNILCYTPLKGTLYEAYKLSELICNKKKAIIRGNTSCSFLEGTELKPWNWPWSQYSSTNLIRIVELFKYLVEYRLSLVYNIDENFTNLQVKENVLNPIMCCLLNNGVGIIGVNKVINRVGRGTVLIELQLFCTKRLNKEFFFLISSTAEHACIQALLPKADWRADYWYSYFHARVFHNTSVLKNNCIIISFTCTNIDTLTYNPLSGLDAPIKFEREDYINFDHLLNRILNVELKDMMLALCGLFHFNVPYFYDIPQSTRIAMQKGLEPMVPLIYPTRLIENSIWDRGEE